MVSKTQLIESRQAVLQCLADLEVFRLDVLILKPDVGDQAIRDGVDSFFRRIDLVPQVGFEWP